MSETGNIMSGAPQKARQSSKIRYFFTLLRALVYRDILAKYKKSALGQAWVVLTPLLYLAVFTMINRFVKFDSDNMPYPIFALTGIVPWTYISQSITSCSTSVISNSSIIKKVSVPREVFPISVATTGLYDFAIRFLLILGMMAWYKVPFTIALLYLPLLIVLSMGLSLAIGMTIASFGTYRTDAIMITPTLMQLWMYASPIMYSPSMVPSGSQKLFMLNPVVGLVSGFRDVILRGHAPTLEPLLYSTAIIVVLLLIGWPLYRWSSQYFADVV